MDALKEIRDRSSDDFLESKLESVFLNQGYTKSSVNEYVAHLLRELDYQKESFEIQMREVLEEKEKILNERNLLAKQLEDALNANAQLQEKLSAQEAEPVVKNQPQTHNTYDKLEEHLNNLNMYCQKMDTQFGQESKNVKVTEEQLRVDREELDKLRKENAELNRQLDDMVVNYDEVLKLSQDQAKELELAMEKNKVTVEAPSVNDAEFQKIKNNNQILQTEIYALTKSVREVSSKVISQNTELNRLTKELENLRIENNSVVQERTEMHLRLSSYIEMFNELKDEFECLEASSAVLKRQLEEQRDKNRVLTGLSSNSDFLNI